MAKPKKAMGFQFSLQVDPPRHRKKQTHPHLVTEILEYKSDLGSREEVDSLTRKLMPWAKKRLTTPTPKQEKVPVMQIGATV